MCRRAQEPMSVLKGTLAGLAGHPGARERYLVVLAMEAGEQGHADKALKLVAEFSDQCAPAAVQGWGWWGRGGGALCDGAPPRMSLRAFRHVTWGPAACGQRDFGPCEGSESVWAPVCAVSESMARGCALLVIL